MSRTRQHNTKKANNRSQPARYDPDDSNISLSELFHDVESISKMPTFVRGKEKKMLLSSIVGNIVGLLILKYIIPTFGEFILRNSNDGFFSVTGGLAQAWVSLTATLQPVLLWSITVSLVLSLAVVILSLGMTKAVREPVHWLTWLATITPGVSAVGFFVIAVLFIGFFVLTLVIWLIIITIAVVVVIGFFAALFNG